MTRVIFPWIGGVALAGCAVFFAEPVRTYVLLGVMLFFPLLDRHWRLPDLPHQPRHIAAWLGLLFATTILLWWQPHHAKYALTTLLTAALPEEWFFRAYFLRRMEETRCQHRWCANIVTTILFSGLHGLTRGWEVGLSVLVPSLFYGWLYQRTRDLPLLVLIHALSNLIFITFLATPLSALLHQAI